MGTRSCVKIEGVNYAKLYMHWDGYPMHMLPWLKAFNSRFDKNRGDDPEYKFAQLLRFSAKHARKYGLDKNDFTGYGIMSYDNDTGEEYEYTLKSDGSVVYKQLPV